MGKPWRAKECVCKKFAYFLHNYKQNMYEKVHLMLIAVDNAIVIYNRYT